MLVDFMLEIILIDLLSNKKRILHPDNEGACKLTIQTIDFIAIGLTTCSPFIMSKL